MLLVMVPLPGRCIWRTRRPFFASSNSLSLLTVLMCVKPAEVFCPVFPLRMGVLDFIYEIFIFVKYMVELVEYVVSETAVEDVADALVDLQPLIMHGAEVFLKSSPVSVIFLDHGAHVVYLVSGRDDERFVGGVLHLCDVTGMPFFPTVALAFFRSGRGHFLHDGADGMTKILRKLCRSIPGIFKRVMEESGDDGVLIIRIVGDDTGDGKGMRDVWVWYFPLAHFPVVEHAGGADSLLDFV